MDVAFDFVGFRKKTWILIYEMEGIKRSSLGIQ